MLSKQTIPIATGQNVLDQFMLNSNVNHITTTYEQAKTFSIILFYSSDEEYGWFNRVNIITVLSDSLPTAALTQFDN